MRIMSVGVDRSLLRGKRKRGGEERKRVRTLCVARVFVDVVVQANGSVDSPSSRAARVAVAVARSVGVRRPWESSLHLSSPSVCPSSRSPLF